MSARSVPAGVTAVISLPQPGGSGALGAWRDELAGGEISVRAALDKTRLTAKVGDILNHWPVAGLAVAVIRSGSLEWFHGHGVADIDAGTPVDEDTVFRIASLTKTITAIAVMQLEEQGLVELDAPAADYLRAYRLVPARAGFGPVTLRHLLTHTAGVRAVRTASDLLRPALGWGVPAGRPVPALAEYYRAGLRFDTDPGTRWAYSNHGFAALGQIVEDVTGDFSRPLRPGARFRPAGHEPLRPGPRCAGDSGCTLTATIPTVPHRPTGLRIGHLRGCVQPRTRRSGRRPAPGLLPVVLAKAALSITAARDRSGFPT